MRIAEGSSRAVARGRVGRRRAFPVCRRCYPSRSLVRNNSAVSSKEAHEQYQVSSTRKRTPARMATPMNYIENKRAARHVHLLHTTSMKMHTPCCQAGLGHDGAHRGGRPRRRRQTRYIRRSELPGNTAIATVLRALKVWEYKSSHVVQNIEDVVQTLRGKSTTTPITLPDKGLRVLQRDRAALSHARLRANRHSPQRGDHPQHHVSCAEMRLCCVCVCAKWRLGVKRERESNNRPMLTPRASQGTRATRARTSRRC